jgi:DNA-binding NtrC family response regulator
VVAGRFRADLDYRLNVVPLRLPALRARRSDIPQLVTFFMERFARKLGKRMLGVSPETMTHLTAYAWPGNVRVLSNLIERAVVLFSGPLLTLDATSAGSDRSDEALGGGRRPNRRQATRPARRPRRDEGDPRPGTRQPRATLSRLLWRRSGGATSGPSSRRPGDGSRAHEALPGSSISTRTRCAAG